MAGRTLAKPQKLDAAGFRRAMRKYDSTSRVADAELYALCAKYPGHQNKAEINAKLLIIGRVMASGIERKIPSEQTQGSSLSQLAKRVFQRRKILDRLIDGISLGNHLGENMLKPVISAHGALVTLLSDITRDGQAARSFVSKYLHFHRPVVPVYDSIVAKTLPGLVRWKPEFEGDFSVRGQDSCYRHYVLRFWQFERLVRSWGIKATVKELDYYLLNRSGS